MRGGALAGVSRPPPWGPRAGQAGSVLLRAALDPARGGGLHEASCTGPCSEKPSGVGGGSEGRGLTTPGAPGTGGWDGEGTGTLASYGWEGQTDTLSKLSTPSPHCQLRSAGERGVSQHQHPHSHAALPGGSRVRLHRPGGRSLRGGVRRRGPGSRELPLAVALALLGRRRTSR